jgi:hypothetical protein
MTNLLPQPSGGIGTPGGAELREIIVGCTLGDLNIAKRGDQANARLRFAQSPIHSEYLLYLLTNTQFLSLSVLALLKLVQFMFLAQEGAIPN